jgi:threonine synthase
MAKPLGLQCVRCTARYPTSHFAEDCPACRPTVRSNLSVVYDASLSKRRDRPGQRSGPGLWRFGDVMPVQEANAVTLGEGQSPLHHLGRVGKSLGLSSLFGKDETRNPTGSFKDRLACMAISAAKEMGANTIVSSSSGNAGAAAAAYAAKAGLPCVIFTFKGTAGAMVSQMRAYGATVVAVENKADRWVLMEHAVKRYGWFPTSPFFGPVVGSNPFGIEGYKTLAYEIAEQMNWQVPDWCVLPVCYGDALVGMWRGFQDMMAFGWTDRMPRMVAAEIYGSLGAALSQGTDLVPEMPKTHDTAAISIGATRATFQGLDILRRGNGIAMSIGNDAMLRWQSELASKEGLYVEPTSAVPLAAIERLREDRRIGERDTVVALFTASGLKDPPMSDKVSAEPILVPGDIEKAIVALRSAKIFPAKEMEAAL